MKARYLKALLGTTRITAEYGEYIAVGSHYVHNLISVDKKTLRVRYALTFPQGADDRTYLERQHDERDDLLPIWDKLAELVKSGEIRDIIDGVDDIPEDKRIPIFLVDGYSVVETHGDFLGWPNTTFDGKLLHDNTGFLTRESAVSSAIANAEASLRFIKESIAEREAELVEKKARLAEVESALAVLK